MNNSISFYLESFDTRAIISIIERLYRVNNVYTSSVIALVRRNIPLLVNHFPRNCDVFDSLSFIVSGVFSYALLVNCLVTILKFKNKHYNLEEDVEFVQVYNGLKDSIQFAMDHVEDFTDLQETSSVWKNRFGSLPDSSPINITNVTKYVKEVLKLFSGRVFFFVCLKKEEL